jgi:hypothetical protein
MRLNSDASMDRFRPVAMLKSDHFSSVTRGFWRTDRGEVEAVLRNFYDVPWWTRPIARFFARNEIRALERLTEADVGPVLLARGKGFLVRSWVEALPMHLAQPKGDVAFFKDAKKILRTMRHAGVAHNDLAKQQNWLRDSNGHPRVTDFQLAAVSKRQGRAFRIAAREDLRHLLKHKRNYCPDALTASERKMLAQKSLPSRIWMATGKRVYNFVTRNIMGYMDREGAGIDTIVDAPRIAKRLAEHSHIKDAEVVPYPTPRGARLYAFVESTAALNEEDLRDHLSAASLPMPTLVQIVERLPRANDGHVREDVLRLIAQNQVDMIDKLALDSENQKAAMKIIDGRLNRTDRRLREPSAA